MSIERFDLQTGNFAKMADFFYTNGYIILDNALEPDTLNKLKLDLNNVHNNFQSLKPEKEKKKDLKGKRHDVYKCFFENSPATVDVIENSKLTDFAQHVIADVPGLREGSNSLAAHVIHNNAFIVPPGGRGQSTACLRGTHQCRDSGVGRLFPGDPGDGCRPASADVESPVGDRSERSPVGRRQLRLDAG